MIIIVIHLLITGLLLAMYYIREAIEIDLVILVNKSNSTTKYLQFTAYPSPTFTLWSMISTHVLKNEETEALPGKVAASWSSS